VAAPAARARAAVAAHHGLDEGRVQATQRAEQVQARPELCEVALHFQQLAVDLLSTLQRLVHARVHRLDTVAGVAELLAGLDCEQHGGPLRHLVVLCVMNSA
jgi:hypothetical protein